MDEVAASPVDEKTPTPAPVPVQETPDWKAASAVDPLTREAVMDRSVAYAIYTLADTIRQLQHRVYTLELELQERKRWQNPPRGRSAT